MKEDHIVEEVRKHRREIEEECGNDFKLIIARTIENQKKWAARQAAKRKGNMPANGSDALARQNKAVV